MRVPGKIKPLHANLACDVYFIGADERQHAFTDHRAHEVPAEIKLDHHAIWCEIRETAEDNYKGLECRR